MLNLRRLTNFWHVFLYALTPAAGVSGGLALATLVSAAGLSSLRPSLLRRAFAKRPPLALLLAAAFAAWAVLTTLWSPYPDHSQAGRFAGMFVLGFAFVFTALSDGEARRLTRAGLTAALIVLIIMLSVEAMFDTPLNRAVRPSLPDWMLQAKPATGVVVLMSFTWALAGRWAPALSRHGLFNPAVLSIIATGVLAAQFDQLVNLAAFAAGLIAFIVGFMAPRFALWCATSAAALWMLAAPFVTPLALADPQLAAQAPYSLAARIGIWNYVSGRIGEAPIFGHGLDASRAVTDQIVVHGEPMRAVSLHPHSASLQIWFETGAIGALLAAAALLAGGWALTRALSHDRGAAAAASATIACIFVSANLSYGVWQEWWNATMFLAAAAIGASALRADSGVKHA